MSSIVIHQPEYFPWPNLFFKMVKCNKFIFLDSVQYARRSFQNRNILGKDGKIFYITVPIQYARRDTLIRDIKIDNSKKWIEEHLKNFHYCYKKTKFYKIVIDLIDAEYHKYYQYLNELNQENFDFVFYIAGVDIHFNDRLGKLKVSDEGIRKRDEIVTENFFVRGI